MLKLEIDFDSISFVEINLNVKSFRFEVGNWIP